MMYSLRPSVAALIFLICLLATEKGRGAIVYVDFQMEENWISDLTPLVVDIDGNGTDDFRFFVLTFVTVDPVGEERLMGVFEGLTVNLVELDPGTMIDSVPDPPLDWGVFMQSLSGCPFVEGLGVVCAGPLAGDGGLFGFEFQIDGNAHYGWARYEPNEPFTSGYLLEWAYESEPGVGIAAGAIPEPDAVVLFMLACGALASRRRHRSGLR